MRACRPKQFGRNAYRAEKRAMVYRRTHQVVRRLAARRSAILAAARDAAANGGMAAVQIAPVAIRANVAAGTVYRYFPSKAEIGRASVGKECRSRWSPEH